MVIVMLYTLRWCAITLCDMEKYHYSREVDQTVHFNGDRTIKCFRHMIIHNDCVHK